jgi:hypothetical protein
MCAERAGVDAGPLADLGEREAFSTAAEQRLGGGDGGPALVVRRHHVVDG